MFTFIIGFILGGLLYAAYVLYLKITGKLISASLIDDHYSTIINTIMSAVRIWLINGLVVVDKTTGKSVPNVEVKIVETSKSLSDLVRDELLKEGFETAKNDIPH